VQNQNLAFLGFVPPTVMIQNSEENEVFLCEKAYLQKKDLRKFYAGQNCWALPIDYKIVTYEYPHLHRKGVRIDGKGII